MFCVHFYNEMVSVDRHIALPGPLREKSKQRVQTWLGLGTFWLVNVWFWPSSSCSEGLFCCSEAAFPASSRSICAFSAACLFFFLLSSFCFKTDKYPLNAHAFTWHNISVFSKTDKPKCIRRIRSSFASCFVIFFSFTIRKTWFLHQANMIFIDQNCWRASEPNGKGATLLLSAGEMWYYKWGDSTSTIFVVFFQLQLPPTWQT